MLKKIFGGVAVLGLLAYIIYGLIQFSGSTIQRQCTGVKVEIMDSLEKNLVSPPEVLHLMHLNNLDLVGQRLDNIQFQRVERVVSVLSMVERVESYSTNAGIVHIRVWQHDPVLRIMSDSGSYYVNSNGKQLDISYQSAADVLIASGSIKDSSVVTKLYQLAMNFRKDSFWSTQIEQIYVEENGEWTLIPRVGRHEIQLGLPVQLDDKLSRLKLFYSKALPKVGWERYSSINLKYRNQVVCTLKKN